MAKRAKCPKCQRDTWSEKWLQCSSGDCLYAGSKTFGEVAVKKAKARADAAGDKRQQKRKTFAPTAEEVREQGPAGVVTSGSMRLRPLPGEKCPTCNRKVPKRRKADATDSL